MSFAVGLVVAGGLYLLFSRGIDLEAEKPVIAASQRRLEGDGVGWE